MKGEIYLQKTVYYLIVSTVLFMALTEIYKKTFGYIPPKGFGFTALFMIVGLFFSVFLVFANSYILWSLNR